MTFVYHLIFNLYADYAAWLLPSQHLLPALRQSPQTVDPDRDRLGLL